MKACTGIVTDCEIDKAFVGTDFGSIRSHRKLLWRELPAKHSKGAE